MTDKPEYIGPGDKVPFVSQIEDVSDPAWQDKFCGIVSAYMVMWYWWKQQAIPHVPSLDEVSSHGLDIDGYKEDTGWIHTKLAAVARNYHLRAVVRSWMLRDNDLEIMLNQERLNSENEASRYSNQVTGEFVSTLYRELSNGVPVILSVKPGFGSNGDSHLIVITGISEDMASVRINDPQTRKTAAGEELGMDRLIEYCNFNAVFIYR